MPPQPHHLYRLVLTEVVVVVALVTTQRMLMLLPAEVSVVLLDQFHHRWMAHQGACFLKSGSRCYYISWTGKILLCSRIGAINYSLFTAAAVNALHFTLLPITLSVCSHVAALLTNMYFFFFFFFLFCSFFFYYYYYGTSFMQLQWPVENGATSPFRQHRAAQALLCKVLTKD